MSKKAQAWGFDLMIASAIFIAGIIMFYLHAISTSNEAEEVINTMTYEGNTIGNILLSNGFPLDWDETNVISPGILTGNKIDLIKLEKFYNFSVKDYSKSKSIFNMRHDYYIYLSENFTISGGQIEGIGKNPSNPKNLIKITRLTLYNNKPVTLYIEIWE